jgi:hypothetical protein
MTNDTIGVDISKDHLDAYRMSDGARRRFTNDGAGQRAFKGWLNQPGSRIVYEPTGPYHRAFERSLAADGFALVKVNPRQARRFAEATGKLAKTDRLDAAMLARMGALLDLEARPVRSPILTDLKDLHMAREALVKNRTAAKNRAKTLSVAILKRHNGEQLRQIERQMAAIEKEIMVIIKADPDMARRSISSSRSPASRPSPPSRSSSTCQSWERSKTARPPHSPVSPPSQGSPETGPAAHSSAAVAPTSARPSTCPLSSQSASTPTSRENTIYSRPMAKPQSSPSQPSCEG